MTMNPRAHGLFIAIFAYVIFHFDNISLNVANWWRKVGGCGNIGNKEGVPAHVYG